MDIRGVHPDLLEIFEPIERDLRAAGFRAKLRPERRVKNMNLMIAALWLDGVLLGIVSADPEASRPRQINLMASQIQTMVLENVRRGQSSLVWPQCRQDHPHPMEVERTMDAEPVWTCPQDHRYRVAIGDVRSK